MKYLSVLCLALLPATLAAQETVDASYWAETHPAVTPIIESYAEMCRTEAGGELIYANETIDPFTETDLDGDGAQDDLVLDMGQIYCSLALTLWAGTGGSPVHFILDGATAQSWSGFHWEVERVGNSYTVILLGRHGSACDSAGASPCVQAIIAHEGAFLTVRYPESAEEQ